MKYWPKIQHLFPFVESTLQIKELQMTYFYVTEGIFTLSETETVSADSLQWVEIKDIKAAFLQTYIFCKVETEDIALRFLVCIFFNLLSQLFNFSFNLLFSALSFVKDFDAFFFSCWRFSSFLFFFYIFLVPFWSYVV